jgi:hypothetical protein
MAFYPTIHCWKQSSLARLASDTGHQLYTLMIAFKLNLFGMLDFTPVLWSVPHQPESGFLSVRIYEQNIYYEYRPAQSFFTSRS